MGKYVLCHGYREGFDHFLEVGWEGKGEVSVIGIEILKDD